MDVSVLGKGRFEKLSDVQITAVGPNAWELDIGLAGMDPKRVRRGPNPEDWDGAIFLLDDRETEPALGSGQAKGRVKVTVFVL